MFLMGVTDETGKKEYFAGAYPSMCGKTSTAMVPGESIVGDDIAYLRAIDGKAYCVNVERGIFGIIKDVNVCDDPVLFKSLTKEGEVIFSNILIDDGVPFWIGKSKETPHKGINFSGEWVPGKTDSNGVEITPSHKNARFTIRLKDLENVDENLENPKGVEVKGLIYGGRDSDTSVPVEQALSWQHGIIIKAASLESETTAATLGKEGVRVFNPMSNMDFLSIPLGKYIDMNLEFANKLSNPPLIFSVNYFLRGEDGMFLNGIADKKVWLKWIRQRSDGKVKGLVTPTGIIPQYEDLAALFKSVLDKEYTKEDYIKQFSLRIPENLAKLERIENIYKEQKDIPGCMFKELEEQRARLKVCQKDFGDYVSPTSFKAE
jgi:phosphoenolpyruvate carboxykinase (GTP)